jgi:hypothetical protein
MGEALGGGDRSAHRGRAARGRAGRGARQRGRHGIEDAVA